MSTDSYDNLNPWKDTEEDARPPPVTAPLAASLEASGAEENDPWAQFEAPLVPGPVLPPERAHQAAIEEFDPFSPRRQSIDDRRRSFEGSLGRAASGKAALSSPEASTASASLNLPGSGHDHTDIEAGDGNKTPILSTLGSLFKRPLSGTTTPTPERMAVKQSGLMQAIAGTGGLSPRAETPPPPPPKSSEKATSPEPGTETPFDFNRFLEQMRDRRADPIARYLRSFLKEFAKRQWKVQDQIRVINDFLDFISTKMRTNDIWSSASDHDFDNAVEGMEKLVMNRLYDQTFTPALLDNSRSNNPTDDLERDHVLQQRIRLFSWIREEHLDLPEPTEERSRFLSYAQTELRKINQYKAPRDKLITILNCCKVIYGLMRHTSGGKEEGADLFVPYLILIVLRANPDHLVSNMQYIQRFRNPERLQGEAGYYLSSLNGAISFVETLDRSALSNISQDDFEHHMEQAVADVEESAHRAAPAPVTLPPEPDAAAAQPVQGGMFDNLHPIDAIRGVFSDLSLSSKSSQPPQLVAGVPVTATSPRRKRGYTASVYSRSNESLVSPTLPLSPQPAPPAPTPEEQDARRKQQAHLATLASMFPSVESSVLEIVLLSHGGDLMQSIDSLLEMA